MIATYGLANYLASFEFFNWLVMVQADGADRICFDLTNPKLKNFTPADVMRRFHSIIEPGPALAGLEYYCGGTQTQLRATPSQLLPWFNSGKRFARLKTVKPPKSCKYTVTMRNNTGGGARGRDSNSDAWCKFANEIDAIVISDYYDKEIHLHDRMALYAGAKMNFGVCNGPVHMISLTPYPVAMFVNGQSARNTQIRWGMKPEQKYPWMLNHQHMIWKDDNDTDTLLRTFDSLKL